MKGTSPFSRASYVTSIQAMILYLYRNVLINVQCLVLRIKVICDYRISRFFINLLEIIRFIGFVHACLKTKSQTSQLLSGKNLDVHFFFSPVPILNGYKVFESLLVYFLTLFFLFVCFLQPHAFTSMDKDFFFSSFTFKTQIKNLHS